MAQDNYEDKVEYQADDGDENLVYDEGKEQPEDVVIPDDESRKFSTKNIFITIVVLIFALLIGYKLYSIFFAGKTQEALIPPAKVVETIKSKVPQFSTLLKRAAAIKEADKTTEVKKPVEIAPITKTEVTPVATVTQAQTKQVAAVKTLSIGQTVIERLQKTNERLIQQMQLQQQMYQTKVGALEQQTSGLNENVGSLHRAIRNLTVQIRRTKETQRIVSAYRRNVQKRRAQAIRHRKQYFVKAVIPGRAWLKGADGSSLTITVGDNLSGYGRITAIDPYSGRVMTTSGYVIRYGVSDT